MRGAVRRGRSARSSPFGYHGKAYYQMKSSYDYGLSKIYELVINNNPAYAFLLETNTLLHNKFVVAHVLGHTDFFKNNIWFEPTNRQMVESVSQNASRIRQYGLEEGSLEVEQFLDAVLALEDHVDPYPRKVAPDSGEHAAEGGGLYEDLFEESLEPNAEIAHKKVRRIPPEPEQDLLRFLLEYGDHLEEWQKDVIAIVREESLYFVPQMMTKIMNEGWACFWHSHIMRELELTDDEFVEFGRLHSSVCTPGHTRMNPYLVGLRIFEDIEKRFGREKLFEVRTLENDVSFIRSYLTEDLCHDLDLFTFALDEDWKITDKGWEHVRDAICNSMTNFGRPLIVVEDGDYRSRRELYLRHCYDGRDLDRLYAERTLQHIYRLWGHPVHVETAVEGRPTLYSCEGESVTSRPLPPA
ncbi:MAG: SpoVR family protein [Mycobacterium leprae]